MKVEFVAVWTAFGFRGQASMFSTESLNMAQKLGDCRQMEPPPRLNCDFIRFKSLTQARAGLSFDCVTVTAHFAWSSLKSPTIQQIRLDDGKRVVYLRILPVDIGLTIRK